MSEVVSGVLILLFAMAAGALVTWTITYSYFKRQIRNEVYYRRYRIYRDFITTMIDSRYARWSKAHFIRLARRAHDDAHRS